MTAYEAFGRVVADRGFLPEVRLTWPTGTLHAAENPAAMREVCNALKTSLAAIGDPVDHPLRGIEQTKWAPAWTQEFKGATLPPETSPPPRPPPQPDRDLTPFLPPSLSRPQRLAATLKSSTVELVRAADAFAAIIGFPPGFYDRAEIRASHDLANSSLVQRPPTASYFSAPAIVSAAEHSGRAPPSRAASPKRARSSARNTT